MDIDSIIAKAGGPTAVARALGRHHTTVLGWRRVPAEHARELARLAGLHPSEVRPDVYDPPPTAVAGGEPSGADLEGRTPKRARRSRPRKRRVAEQSSGPSVPVQDVAG